MCCALCPGSSAAPERASPPPASSGLAPPGPHRRLAAAPRGRRDPRAQREAGTRERGVNVTPRRSSESTLRRLSAGSVAVTQGSGPGSAASCSRDVPRGRWAGSRSAGGGAAARWPRPSRSGGVRRRPGGTAGPAPRPRAHRTPPGARSLRPAPSPAASRRRCASRPAAAPPCPQPAPARPPLGFAALCALPQPSPRRGLPRTRSDSPFRGSPEPPATRRRRPDAQPSDPEPSPPLRAHEDGRASARGPPEVT